MVKKFNNKEKLFIEARQAMEKLDRQVLNLENSVAELTKPEQIEEFAWQRDTLSNHVEGFSEQATKAGMGLQVEQLQDRLGQIQIQLANRDKELVAARKSKLFVESVPEDARVRILNIKPKFFQGMELEPGRYHLEVAAKGYDTKKRWINLEAGHKEPFRFELAIDDLPR